MWLADIVIGFVLVFFLLLCIRYWSFFKKSQLSFLFLLSIFLLKISLGILYTYIQLNFYKHPLGGDSMVFFNDAKVIYQSFFTFKKDFFSMLFSYQDHGAYFIEKYYTHMSYWNEGMQTSVYNDNRIFTKFNVILMFIGHGNIYLHMIVINFISLVGLVALFNGLKTWISSVPFRMIAVFFFPTTLLWCSAIHKETLLLFFIGLSFHLYFKYTKDPKIWRLLLLLLLLFMSIYIKPYISSFVVAFIVMLLLFKNHEGKIKYFTSALAIVLFFGGFYLSQNLNFQFNPWRPILKKQIEFGFAAEGGFFMFNQRKVLRIDLKDSIALKKVEGDSIIVPQGFQYDYWEIENLDKRLTEQSSTRNETFALLHKMPKAGSAFQYNLKIETFYQYCRSLALSQYIVLFKPLFFDAHSLMAYFSSIENLFLLLLALISIVFLIRNRFKHKPSIYLLLLFILIMFFILGFTVNISGALSRYRAPLMPLFLAVCFSMFPFAAHQANKS